MKKRKIVGCLLGTVLAFSALGGCGNEKSPSGDDSPPASSKTEITVESVQEGYSRYDVKESTRKTEGFGAQFDTCILEKLNGITEEEWQIQVNALEEMELQSVRIRFYPEMYERGNDNDDSSVFDFNSPNVDFSSIEMGYLYRLLDVFEKNNVKVDLSWYGCRTSFASEDGKVNGSWLGGKFGENGIDSWMVRPTLTAHPDEEYAESVAACLHYLINVKKYTCIYEYSLFPEPEGIFGHGNTAQYIRICNLVKERLRDYSLDGKVRFSGPADYNNDPVLYDNSYLSKMTYDKATSSVYAFKDESTNRAMLDFAKRYVAVCDKYNISWGVAESGTSNFKTPVSNYDSETYERAHCMARIAVNFLNGGCTNIKYFIFSECYYDGTLNELGMFTFRDDDGDGIAWKAKPIWYSWALLCKYSEFGSTIFPVTDSYAEGSDDEVSIAALKLLNGKWTYFATNSGTSSKKIALVNGRADRPDSMGYIRLTGASIPETGERKVPVPSSTVDTRDGVAYFQLPAKSFVVLSDKQ